VSKTMSFFAIVVDEKIPNDIRVFLDEIIEVRKIFGTKCYVILEDEDISPLNLLDEECYRKVKRWLSTVNSDKVFSYTWRA
jgi:hypothetical protein